VKSVDDSKCLMTHTIIMTHAVGVSQSVNIEHTHTGIIHCVSKKNPRCF